ncbi:acyl-coenzyme A thioesterase 13-like isoform X3 [Rhipicephalus microplus]|uniref:acyl-coenzyme A thioesterase 13-like isoform X3 n=1 Tax=Rhipicephalus microplus TaxID=6941 RepID=UPI003F6AAB91
MAAYTLDAVRQLLQRVVSSGTFTRHLEAVRVVSAADGKCTAELTVNENIVNNLGTMQGSFSASIVDVVSTFALLTLRGVANVSVDMNMRSASFRQGKESAPQRSPSTTTCSITLEPCRGVSPPASSTWLAHARS